MKLPALPGFVAALVGIAVCGTAAAAPWVYFVDETPGRIAGDPATTTADTQEKDYAWGDLDGDGDVDLVVVRKEPYTTAGKRTNVLLLNEGGVLVDRTLDFATASDVPGDAGFDTATNDRDVALADVDGDGWPDVITSPAIGDGDPKHVGHPRIYRNLGCNAPCAGTADWLGLRYEEARIPLLVASSGQPGHNPRFAAVAAGDVTGDGYVDLYFSDHDSSGSGLDVQPPGADFDDRLLINLGTANPGFFVDSTAAFTGTIDVSAPVADPPFPRSAFGTRAAIADINGDGAADVLKNTSLNTPVYVGIAYNDPANPGALATHRAVYESAAYFFSVGDLNNDDLPDLAVTDDGQDRYLLNQGVGTDGVAEFTTHNFSYLHNASVGAPFAASDDGFGGNSVIADLDGDGWRDVIVADQDEDIPGCSRRAHIFRNLAGSPGDSVFLEEQTAGPDIAVCATFNGNPAECTVAGIPSNELQGIHDVAVLDLDGDGSLDLVLGRCDGTRVFMNRPQGPLAGAVPDGGPVAGVPLRLGKAHGKIALTWGASCSGFDSDYAIYSGRLDGDFSQHTSVVCSTAGATDREVVPGSGSVYYLVVPHTGSLEGSYGLAGDGTPRPAAALGCLPQGFGDCL